MIKYLNINDIGPKPEMIAFWTLAFRLTPAISFFKLRHLNRVFNNSPEIELSYSKVTVQSNHTHGDFFLLFINI
jgi:hypothetical protein